MRAEIKKGKAMGTVNAPSSKSMAHRLLIAAALAKGVSTLRGVPMCEDVLATLDCLRALGVPCELRDDTVTVQGQDISSLSPNAPLCCRESGSTLRFLLPLLWLTGKEATLRGAKSLICRPMDIYEELAKEKGLFFEKSDTEIRVSGLLTSGEYTVAGNVSSQFITGLLYALSAIGEESRIHIEKGIASRSYIELTLAALSHFGIDVIWENDNTLFLRGAQRPHPAELTVEGDYSGAAFLDALTELGGRVHVDGLFPRSLQGDAVYRDYYRQLREGTPTLSLENCPDLGPILFTLAAVQNGAVFTQTDRLRIKESDRVLSMAQELSKFGCTLTIGADCVIVPKAVLYTPTLTLLGHNDHRIVMSLAVLSTRFGGIIEGAEAVNKSFPDFFQKLSSLGIEVTLCK